MEMNQTTEKAANHSCESICELYGELVSEIFPVLAPPDLLLDDEQIIFEILKQSQSRNVLELGAGYGRVIFGLRASGLQAQGIELSASMIAKGQDIAKAKNLDRPNINEGNMMDSSTWPKEKFDAVICTDATVALLNGYEDLRQLVHLSKESLSEDGQIIWTFPSLERSESAPTARPAMSFEHEDHRYVLVEEHVESLNDDEQLTVKKIYKFCLNGALIAQHIALHRRFLYSIEAVEKIFAEYGLSNVDTVDIDDRVIIRACR